jgi:hypothetical protein
MATSRKKVKQRQTHVFLSGSICNTPPPRPSLRGLRDSTLTAQDNCILLSREHRHMVGADVVGRDLATKTLLFFLSYPGPHGKD